MKKGELGVVHRAGSSRWSERNQHNKFKQSRKQQHNRLRAGPRRNDGEVPSVQANAHCARRGGTRHRSGPIHGLARVDRLRGYVKPHRGGGQRGQLLHLLRGFGVLPKNLRADVPLLRCVCVLFGLAEAELTPHQTSGIAFIQPRLRHEWWRARIGIAPQARGGFGPLPAALSGRVHLHVFPQH